MPDSSARVFTEADFDQLSWHDNSIYGLSIDNDITEWKSDFVLDLDYIVEWLCGVDKTAQFWISAATLAFHHVTDLKLSIDWGDSRMQVAVGEMSIDRIERQRVEKQLICLDRPYYRWTIRLNSPRPGGEISFGASGFTQSLRQEPILCDEQKLPPSQRARTDRLAADEWR
ncbi:MAG: hypothetical protein L0312_07400 [Acidobacteria bacterium]|nr:hypothetical protein [Acidobacteriota bacterium]